MRLGKHKAALLTFLARLADTIQLTMRASCPTKVVENFSKSKCLQDSTSESCMCDREEMKRLWSAWDIKPKGTNLGESDNDNAKFIFDTIKSMAHKAISTVGKMSRNVGTMARGVVRGVVEKWGVHALQQVIPIAIKGIAKYFGVSLTDGALTCICENYMLPISNNAFQLRANSPVANKQFTSALERAADDSPLQADPLVLRLYKVDKKTEQTVCKYRVTIHYQMCSNCQGKSCDISQAEDWTATMLKNTQCRPSAASCGGGSIVKKDVTAVIQEGHNLPHCKETFVLIDGLVRAVATVQLSVNMMFLMKNKCH
jgi:Zn finger protein HypA/HybF involved in hydrogenase expression